MSKKEKNLLICQFKQLQAQFLSITGALNMYALDQFKKLATDTGARPVIDDNGIICDLILS